MRRLISAAVFLLLVGCASRPPPITVDEPPPPVVCTQTPKPDRVTLKDTPPRVVLDAETGQYGYWFATDLYAGIAENLQTLRRYQGQLRAVGAYYRRCIDDHNRRLAETDDGA